MTSHGGERRRRRQNVEPDRGAPGVPRQPACIAIKRSAISGSRNQQDSVG